MFRAILNALCINIILFMSSKGDKIMMAMFFAQRVIFGKTNFEEVPTTLKQGVAEILIDSGVDFLVPVEFGGTKENSAA